MVNQPTEGIRDLMTLMQTKRSEGPSANVGYAPFGYYTCVLIVFPTVVASSDNDTADNRLTFNKMSVNISQQKVSHSSFWNQSPVIRVMLTLLCASEWGETLNFSRFPLCVDWVHLMDCCVCLCIASFIYTSSLVIVMWSLLFSKKDRSSC